MYQRGLSEVTQELQQRVRLLQRWAIITGHDDPFLKIAARLAAHRAAVADAPSASASASATSSSSRRSRSDHHDAHDHEPTGSRKRKRKTLSDHEHEAFAAMQATTENEHRVRTEHVAGREWVAGILREKGESDIEADSHAASALPGQRPIARAKLWDVVDSAFIYRCLMWRGHCVLCGA